MRSFTAARFGKEPATIYDFIVKAQEFDGDPPGTGFEETSNFVFLQVYATSGLQRGPFSRQSVC
jgi:hypothetical protein